MTRIAPVATIISGVVNYEVAISIERDIALLKPDYDGECKHPHIASTRHSWFRPNAFTGMGGSLSFIVQRATGARLKRTVSVGARIADQTEILAASGQMTKCSWRPERPHHDKIDNISRTYSRDGVPVTALREASFSIDAGDFVVIRGVSGSGKSTLLNILGCLDSPSTGTYSSMARMSRIRTTLNCRASVPKRSASSFSRSTCSRAPPRLKTSNCR